MNMQLKAIGRTEAGGAQVQDHLLFALGIGNEVDLHTQTPGFGTLWRNLQHSSIKSTQTTHFYSASGH